MRAHTEQVAAGKGGGDSKYSEASKVVRMPDPFGEMEVDVSGWLEFSSLKARLRYIKPEFEDELKAAEELELPAETATMTAEAAGRSQRLYSVLTGLLRRRPLFRTHWSATS